MGDENKSATLTSNLCFMRDIWSLSLLNVTFDVIE